MLMVLQEKLGSPSPRDKDQNQRPVLRVAGGTAESQVCSGTTFLGIGTAVRPKLAQSCSRNRGGGYQAEGSERQFVRLFTVWGHQGGLSEDSGYGSGKLVGQRDIQEKIQNQITRKNTVLLLPLEVMNN